MSSITRYHDAAITSEIAAVRDAAPGERNRRLNEAAVKIAAMAHWDGVSMQSCMETLAAAALEAGMGSDEVKRTIASGTRHGLAHPRDPPRGHDGVAAQRPRRRTSASIEEVRVEDTYPPQCEVLDVWTRATSVTDDRAVSSWLESRRISPALVEDLSLARVAPDNMPPWASWSADHRLILPCWCSDMELVTLRARSVSAHSRAKTLPAKGHSAKGCIYCSGAIGDKIVIAEGDPDYLTASTQYTDWCVIGVWSGSWTVDVAAMVPDGALVAIMTDRDRAGDHYAETIARSLQTRCEVLRMSGRSDQDLSDLHVAGELRTPREMCEQWWCPVTRDDTRTVVTSQRQPGDLIEDARDVVSAAANERLSGDCADPAWCALGLRGGHVVSVTSAGQITDLGETALWGVLAREARWIAETQQGERETSPPRYLAQDLCVYPPPLPCIESVISSPRYSRSGALMTRPGYHGAASAWMTHGEWASVNASPSDDEVARAVSLIRDDLLGDFRWSTESDQAAAIAAVVLPTARGLIDGHTPLHLVEAPTAGSGKTLYCDLVSIVATGSTAKAQVLAREEDEVRKMITAALSAGDEIILLDNLPERRVISSQALAAALTSDPWVDRRLGVSERVSLPARCMWMATANNPSLSDELSRRCVRIRISPASETPWLRDGWRHADVAAWALEHRRELVWACCTMVQHWLSHGSPDGPRGLGSYERWARVIGGILGACGISGLLERLSEQYAASDTERGMWAAFVAEWRRKGAQPSTTTELRTMCVDHDLMGIVLGDGGDRSQTTRLGAALAQSRDRVYDGSTIVRLQQHHGRTVWGLRVEGIGQSCIDI